MKTRCAHNQRKSGFFLSFLEKIILGSVFITLSFNGFVPRFNFGPGDYDTLNSILAPSSVLLQVFSLSSVPLSLVNTLMAGSKASTQGKSSPQPERRHENKANSSSDFSITIPTLKLHAPRYEGKASGFSASVFASVRDAWLFFPAGRAEPPPGSAVPVMAVVLFFFLLPRSSLSEGIAVLRRTARP